MTKNSTQLKAGDKVRLLSHRATEGFKIGGIYEIDGVKDYYGENGSIIYTILDEGIRGFVRADNVEKVTLIKRQAKAGERILITQASSYQSGKLYENGTIMRVRSIEHYDCVNCFEYRSVHLSEYEVIVEDNEIVDDTNEGVNDKLAELQAKVTTLEAKIDEINGRVNTLSSPPEDSGDMSLPATENEQRAKAIEVAKEFVKDKTKLRHVNRFMNGREVSYARYDVRMVLPEFIVNNEKGTVVCLLKGALTPEVLSKGIAKCAPGDVFNADIGKAIAIARAFDLDVPKEVANAPQPDEVVVGMWVERFGTLGGKLLDTIEVKDIRKSSDFDCTLNGTYGFVRKDGDRIVEDTNAKY